MRTLAVALLLVLAGCGGSSGSSDPTTKPTRTATPPTHATTKPTVAPPTGTPAPEALSKFRCDKGSKGAWNTSGYLSNDAKTKVTFQVTVYVGEAAGGEEKGKTRQVPSVAPGGSARFVLNGVPATGDGPCHVQVLAQR